MGADRFIAFYGIRFELADDKAGEEAIEEGTEPHIVAATKARLHSYTGRLSDGQPFFILVGTSLGCFGYQDSFHKSVSDSEFSEIVRSTTQRLKDAGFSEEPSLWFQFEGQY